MMIAEFFPPINAPMAVAMASSSRTIPTEKNALSSMIFFCSRWFQLSGT